MKLIKLLFSESEYKKLSLNESAMINFVISKQGFYDNFKKALSIDNDNNIPIYKILAKSFPITKKYNVFISFAHKDFKIISSLALKIEKETGLKCFVDMNYWSYIMDVFNTAKKEYKSPIKPDWLMVPLAAELMKVIARCDYFIFVATKNSYDCTNDFILDESYTHSPWLYFENQCAACFSFFGAQYLSESFEKHPEYIISFKKFIVANGVDDLIKKLK